MEVWKFLPRVGDMIGLICNGRKLGKKGSTWRWVDDDGSGSQVSLRIKNIEGVGGGYAGRSLVVFVARWIDFERHAQ